MGTMCAIYGCPVDNTADPIEPSSRSLRVTAFIQRLAGIGRLPFATAVVEAEGISISSISNRGESGRYLPTTRTVNLPSGNLKAVGYHIRMYPMKQQVLRFVGHQDWLRGRDRILRAFPIRTTRGRTSLRSTFLANLTRATWPISSIGLSSTTERFN